MFGHRRVKRTRWLTDHFDRSFLGLTERLTEIFFRASFLSIEYRSYLYNQLTVRMRLIFFWVDQFNVIFGILINYLWKKNPGNEDLNIKIVSKIWSKL